MRRSDLPFGSEFSPSQIDLVDLLELASTYGGDWRAFEQRIWERYFQQHRDADDYNQRKLANNTKLGMQAYGVIDTDARLTVFGKQLLDLKDDPPALYGLFGRHILADLHGMSLVQCILDMQLAGEDVSLLKLRNWLEERGIHFPRGGKHPSIMRLWLEKAGVFVRAWTVDEGRIAELLGASVDEFESLAGLTTEQRVFLKTLASMPSERPHASNDIEKLAAATYGIRFNEKNLPKQVLYPLRDAGFITLVRGTKKAGRGAKPFEVCPTEKFDGTVLKPLLEQLEAQTTPHLRPFLRMPLAEILEGVEHGSVPKRGLALEALAIYLMRLIGLTYVATRLRGSSTGGAEVDFIFHATRLVFSRWQVQCKNTRRVSLDDVAKEVGLTHMLRSNVIVIVTTGELGREAKRYAANIMSNSNLCIVSVEGRDLSRIKSNPSAIVDVLEREAHQAMRLKTLDAALGGMEPDDQHAGSSDATSMQAAG